MIWAGKPYPLDYGAINLFNSIIQRTKHLKNCAIVTGYELGLSAALKKGSDLWLNTPIYPREASGTSGMTAAMNASVNLSIADGWIPEFIKPNENGFLIPHMPEGTPDHIRDENEADALLTLLENEVVPMYYDQPKQFLKVVKTSMKDVEPEFESGRMAKEYYEQLYK